LKFIKLALILLDEKQFTTHSSPPGACHHAQWMAKGIYCLKIWCFCKQLTLTPRELQALHCICLFTVTIYIKAWFSAPLACDAPLSDVNLLQSLESFTEDDKSLMKPRGRSVFRQCCHLVKSRKGHICLNRLNSGNEVDEGSLVVSEIGPAVRGTPSYVNGHRKVLAA